MSTTKAMRDSEARMRESKFVPNIASWEWLRIHSLVEKEITRYNNLPDNTSDFTNGVKYIELEKLNSLKERVEEVIKNTKFTLHKPG
jgi:uncharacterized protein YlzI (FlbEa/FlbD family)